MVNDLKHCNNVDKACVKRGFIFCYKYVNRLYNLLLRLIGKD